MFQLPQLSNWCVEYSRTKSKAILGRWFTWTFDTTKLEATRGGKECIWNSLIKKKNNKPLIKCLKCFCFCYAYKPAVIFSHEILMGNICWNFFLLETKNVCAKKTWIRNVCSRNQNLVMSTQHQPLGKICVYSPGFWTVFCYSSLNCFLTGVCIWKGSKLCWNRFLVEILPTHFHVSSNRANKSIHHCMLHPVTSVTYKWHHLQLMDINDQTVASYSSSSTAWLI